MKTSDTEHTQPEQNEQTQINFIIQKVYTKDISFESPNVPTSFKLDWNPQANIEISTQSQKIDNNIFEVDLSLTVTAKNQEQNAYVVEIQQSGIFTIDSNTAEDQLGHMLGSFCPNILFPYAKEIIHGLVNKGGFPQLNIAPVNFDELYMQSLAQQRTNQSTDIQNDTQQIDKEVKH